MLSSKEPAKNRNKNQTKQLADSQFGEPISIVV